jgi:hypothetical protein
MHATCSCMRYMQRCLSMQNSSLCIYLSIYSVHSFVHLLFMYSAFICSVHSFVHLLSTYRKTSMHPLAWRWWTVAVELSDMTARDLLHLMCTHPVLASSTENVVIHLDRPVSINVPLKWSLRGHPRRPARRRGLISLIIHGTFPVPAATNCVLGEAIDLSPCPRRRRRRSPPCPTTFCCKTHWFVVDTLAVQFGGNRSIYHLEP